MDRPGESKLLRRGCHVIPPWPQLPKQTHKTLKEETERTGTLPVYEGGKRVAAPGAAGPEEKQVQKHAQSAVTHDTLTQRQPSRNWPTRPGPTRPRPAREPE